MSYNRQTHHRVESKDAVPTIDEDSPLFVRHLSMGPSSSSDLDENHKSLWLDANRIFSTRLLYTMLAGILILLVGAAWIFHDFSTRHRFVPIERAHEQFLQVDRDGEIYIWFRTWGNRKSGIPVLFVHGGPGNAIEDYDDENKGFFSAQDYFVVEVDQRGTGQSQPSVRENKKNIKYYHDISIDQIAGDYELVRKELGLEKWVVFGGSFGSTIGINYGTRYPERCLSLILRGIYLDTAEEVAAIYSRNTYLKNAKRLAEFDILYDYATKTSSSEHLPSNPDDAEGLIRAYYHLISDGDEKAMWHWFVFENNLMETDPANLRDPDEIDRGEIRESRSVAFFETRLWITGSYERPSNLLSRMDQLTTMPIFICQGRRDEVCPPRYARKLADALDDEEAYYSVRFIDSGHEQSDPVMARCLEDALHDFRHELEAERNKGNGTFRHWEPTHSIALLIACDDTSYAWLLIERPSTGVSSRVIRLVFRDANVRILSEE